MGKLENKTAYCRGFIEKKQENKEEKGERPPWSFSPGKVEYNRLLVLDTETTIDIYQNLIFGSFLLVDRKGKNEEIGIFYSDNLPEKDPKGFKELEKYSEKNNITLMSRSFFLKRIFFPECYEKETACIGFNLPFDLSRIANGCSNTLKTKPEKGILNFFFRILMTFTILK